MSDDRHIEYRIASTAMNRIDEETQLFRRKLSAAALVAASSRCGPCDIRVTVDDVEKALEDFIP
jgi:hypothetical protein